MSSFYAELAVAGSTYPLRQCQFGFEQDTDARGRVVAKVRHGQLHLTLDVPHDSLLLDWANTAHKLLAGHITFFETNRLTARETVSFAAGQCVSYQESFTAGDASAGAYVCQLVIATGELVLTPGGPAGAFVAPAARDYAAPAIALLASSPAAPLPIPAPEYTLAEFKKTIWGIDQVGPEVGEQLYQHFNAAKTSADPAPHWAAMETIIRNTNYTDKTSGLPQVLNGGWPPANGGFNKQAVQPAPPDTFDRYQKTVRVGADGAPILEGTFTSPIPKSGAFDYEARALEGQETDHDLLYEIQILKPLPFLGEQASIIPWHGHSGNGVQTKMLFPPRDPATGAFSWDWQALERKGYVKINYKSSPSGKFLISPDGKTATPNLV